MKYLIITAACLVSVAAGCGESEKYPRSVVNDRTTRDATTPRVPNTPTLGRDTPTQGRDANNTGLNTRDRDGTLPTPADQSSSETDLAHVTAIRKRLVDSELSTDAKNVKVISEKGRVTLRGPVRSAEEKDTVARIARDVAGTENVNDLLEIVFAK